MGQDEVRAGGGCRSRTGNQTKARLEVVSDQVESDQSRVRGGGRTGTRPERISVRGPASRPDWRWGARGSGPTTQRGPTLVATGTVPEGGGRDRRASIVSVSFQRGPQLGGGGSAPADPLLSYSRRDHGPVLATGAVTGKPRM